MSRSIPSFMSGFDAWLPPPSAWRVFACQRCEAEMRVPFAPSDKLCGDCRASDRQAAEKTLEERLAEAGAPRKFAAWTRRRWEQCYGAWAEQAELRLLVGWPRDHDPSSVADWRQVRRIHESLVPRMNVPLKIALDPC